jgi:hypothetical protein
MDFIVREVYPAAEAKKKGVYRRQKQLQMIQI